jgi:hypothetical protein
MIVNIQSIILFGLAASMAVLGWFLREMWTAVQKLRDDIHLMREDISLHYIHKEDYKSDIGRIYELLDKIYDRMVK